MLHALTAPIPQLDGQPINLDPGRAVTVRELARVVMGTKGRSFNRIG
jgi:hypothetical protein